MLYFDHNATTPVDVHVAQVYADAVREFWANGSSVHAPGRAARAAFEQARRTISAKLGAASANEIVFTSGGTESNNLALFGVADGGHIVTTETEHSSVLAPCSRIRNASYVRVDANGIVDPDEIRRAIRPDTKLISVAHANNETGVIQPIADIARIAHQHGVLMHCDGVQATGKIAVNVNDLGVDLYSVSGHKLYAPKGTGLLYVRNGLALNPMQFGGRHERERRAGTENIPGAIALAAALELPLIGAEIRDLFERELTVQFEDARIHCTSVPRVPNTSSVRFDRQSGESLLIALDLKGIAVSTGSACASGAIEPSHVLLAMGLTRAQAKSTLRFSFGRTNTHADVQDLLTALESVVKKRRLSYV